MKTKFIATILLVSGVITSCDKSFLEVDPKASVLETNYYKDPTEALNGIVAGYIGIGSEVGWGHNWFANTLGPLNSAADECWAGGGSSTDMDSYHSWQLYNLSAANGPQDMFWNKNYAGVYRANLILTKLEGVPGLSNDLKVRYTAEAKALRAHFYLDLVRLFKNIPLITSPLPASDYYTITQAKPEDVWAQIEKDLTEAIPDLPATVPAVENGRFTKGAAQAMLGKAILFQNNTSRMGEAAGWFNKVNTGPYSLVPNFRDIFDPANRFNSESVFEIAHTSVQGGAWNKADYLGNIYTNMIGPRSYASKGSGSDANHTYVSGWSFNPVIPAFATSIKSDPRYSFTVVNLDSIKALGLCDYQAGFDNTGYFIQKFAPLLKNKGALGAQELNYPNSYIEIRLADTYLMEAEAIVRGGGNAARAQQLLDAVRARVGLGSIPATLDNIYEERRLELATEGHRWFDLVRTGKAAAALAFKGFKAGKNEVLPIPLNELNNTKLVQNPGY